MTEAQELEAVVATQAEINAAAAWNAEHHGCCTRGLADLLARQRLEAVAETEARIVDWLRELAEWPPSPLDTGQQLARTIAATFIADAIERGDHRQQEERKS